MGSKSNSNQSTVYNTSTHYEYNTLDGGAIEAAFEFATDQSEGTLDVLDNSVESAFTFGGEAFDFADTLSGRAFEAVTDTYQTALEAQKTQLGQMSNLVKSTQTQGATDLIDANKDTVKALLMGVTAIVIVLVIASAWQRSTR